MPEYIAGGMKTAVSVNAGLLREADRAAKQLGLSRSRLFSVALESYLRNRRHQEIIERLNRAHSGEPDTGEQRVRAAMKGRFAATVKDRW